MEPAAESDPFGAINRPSVVWGGIGHEDPSDLNDPVNSSLASDRKASVSSVFQTRDVTRDLTPQVEKKLSVFSQQIATIVQNVQSIFVSLNYRKAKDSDLNQYISQLHENKVTLGKKLVEFSDIEKQVPVRLDGEKIRLMWPQVQKLSVQSLEVQSTIKHLLRDLEEQDFIEAYKILKAATSICMELSEKSEDQATETVAKLEAGWNQISDRIKIQNISSLNQKVQRSIIKLHIETLHVFIPVLTKLKKNAMVISQRHPQSVCDQDSRKAQAIEDDLQKLLGVKVNGYVPADPTKEVEELKNISKPPSDRQFSYGVWASLNWPRAQDKKACETGQKFEQMTAQLLKLVEQVEQKTVSRLSGENIEVDIEYYRNYACKLEKELETFLTEYEKEAGTNFLETVEHYAALIYADISEFRKKISLLEKTTQDRSKKLIELQEFVLQFLAAKRSDQSNASYQVEKVEKLYQAYELFDARLADYQERPDRKKITKICFDTFQTTGEILIDQRAMILMLTEEEDRVFSDICQGRIAITGPRELPNVVTAFLEKRACSALLLHDKKAQSELEIAIYSISQDVCLKHLYDKKLAESAVFMKIMTEYEQHIIRTKYRLLPLLDAASKCIFSCNKAGFDHNKKDPVAYAEALAFFDQVRFETRADVVTSQLAHKDLVAFLQERLEIVQKKHSYFKIADMGDVNLETLTGNGGFPQLVKTFKDHEMRALWMRAASQLRWSTHSDAAENVYREYVKWDDRFYSLLENIELKKVVEEFIVHKISLNDFVHVMVEEKKLFSDVVYDFLRTPRLPQPEDARFLDAIYHMYIHEQNPEGRVRKMLQEFWTVEKINAFIKSKKK